MFIVEWAAGGVFGAAAIQARDEAVAACLLGGLYVGLVVGHFHMARK